MHYSLFLCLEYGGIIHADDNNKYMYIILHENIAVFKGTRLHIFHVA